ncbi:hypothetical protein ACFXAZ_02060 [Streptomyces sp. NPDC059477]|uniref:hypothetical protein n=1 Tax=Streptomyces sp. NPDC059477 TaxID=3346847 RepID=UPI0036AC2659
MAEQLVTGVEHVISCAVQVSGGWCHIGLARTRWSIVDGRRATNARPRRYTARWMGPVLSEEYAELVGICAALLAVRGGEAAVAYVSAAAHALVAEAIADASWVKLPAEVDEERVRSALRRLVVLPTGEPRDQSARRYPRQRNQCEVLLQAALATGAEIPTLAKVTAEIRQGVRASSGIPASTTGLAGYTTDFSVTGNPTCAIVPTDVHGRPAATVHVVRLPAALRDNQWGETAAVLLAFIHARRSGFGQAAFYTDAASVISRLRDLTLLRRYSPPEPVPALLGHRVIRRVRGIDAHWISRSSTPAQAAADQAARHASRTGQVTLTGTSEIALDSFLPAAAVRDDAR